MATKFTSSSWMPPNVVLAFKSFFDRAGVQRQDNVVLLPLPRRAQAASVIYALRQRVLVGIIADGHRVYGRGRLRKLDRS